MNISRFNSKTAIEAHQNTILASDVLPKGMTAPFKHAWGYLEGNGIMELHKHEAEEVYFFFEGNGYVIVDDEKQAVSGGDVVEIPSNSMHTVENQSGKPLLWAALWWEL